MKNFWVEIKDDIHEYGVFFVLFLFIFGFPAFLVECLLHLVFSPFVLFNDWSKTWFTGDSK